MTTLPKEPTFADELAELKSSARTLQDVVVWLAARPEVIYQGATFPTAYKIEVDLEYTPSTTMREVAQSNAVTVQAICEVRTKVSPNHELAGIVKDMSSKNVLVFKHAMDLSLNLMEWPMATVLIVSEHIKEVESYKRTSEFFQFESNLNQALEHHFGSVTLDALVQMYNAGLIELVNEVDADMANLATLLFASKKSSSNVVIPHDVSC